MTNSAKAAFVAVLSLGLAVPAYAATLRDHEGVNNSLIIAGIVRDIDEVCPTISARNLRGKAYLLSIYNRARSAGFTHDEVEAFVDDPAEEARLQRYVDAWFASNGGDKGNIETICAIGRAQITADTQIGGLLRND